MKADLEFLHAELRTTTYPYFKSEAFDVLQKSGWISRFQTKSMLMLILILVYCVGFFLFGGTYLRDRLRSYNILFSLYTFLFACIGILHVIGIYWQNQAISYRNLERQDSSIGFFHIFIYLQIIALGIHSLICTIFDQTPADGLFYCACVHWFFGMYLKVIAIDVRSAMIDMHESSKIDFLTKIFLKPRYYYDIPGIYK